MGSSTNSCSGVYTELLYTFCMDSLTPSSSTRFLYDRKSLSMCRTQCSHGQISLVLTRCLLAVCTSLPNDRTDTSTANS